MLGIGENRERHRQTGGEPEHRRSDAVELKQDCCAREQKDDAAHEKRHPGGTRTQLRQMNQPDTAHAAEHDRRGKVRAHGPSLRPARFAAPGR